MLAESVFTNLDWGVLLFYFVFIIVFGLLVGGSQKSAKDYFLSEKKTHWLVICFSIVATETSAITFISVPGLAFKGNLNFIQISFGYIIGRFIVSRYLLPLYYQGELTTAYSLIEKAFGKFTRRLVSLTFILTRILADGVRFFAVAIPLVVILKGYHVFSGFDNTTLYISGILTIGTATMVYVFWGGIRAILWTDLVQLFVYVLGGFVALFLLIDNMESFSEKIQLLASKGKLNVFSFENILTNPYHFVWALIGGAALSFASHGTDQIIVQRLFASRSLKESQKALIWSGIFVFFQFFLFLIIGSLLSLYFNGTDQPKPDQAFVKFIIDALPSGLSGLIVAAILSAAMSTLSSSISAVSNALVFDFYQRSRLGEKASEEKKLKIAKGISVIYFGILTLSAISYINADESVVAIALKVASFTYAGMVCMFFLAITYPTLKPRAIQSGFIVTMLMMSFIVLNNLLPWTTYIMVGLIFGTVATLSINHILKRYKFLAK